MTLLKKFAIALAVVIGVFVVVGFALPRAARVERAVVVEAPAPVVFTVLNGFRQFDQWSPWAELDPDATTTYEGPVAGPGAIMRWAGNAHVGSGSQEILESKPYSEIRVRLEFGDFPGRFESTYVLAAEGAGTRVTWRFDADYGNSLLGRYFGLFADGTLGPDYEKGLARLKKFVEGLPKADFASLPIEPVETRAEPVVLLAARSADNQNAIGVTLGVAYGRLAGFMNARGLKQVGPPLAIYHGIEQGALSFDAAIPVDRSETAGSGPIRFAQMPAGQAVRGIHTGSYSSLPEAHRQMRSYLAAAGLEQAGAPWEQYVSDPGSTPEADLVTHIYYPIKG